MALTCENCKYIKKFLYEDPYVECAPLDSTYSHYVFKEDTKKDSPSKSNGATADYYELPKNAKELQELISYVDMNAQMGEIFRAVYRYGRVGHSPKLRDAKKIKFYIEAEIKRLEKL